MHAIDHDLAATAADPVGPEVVAGELGDNDRLVLYPAGTYVVQTHECIPSAPPRIRCGRLHLVALVARRRWMWLDHHQITARTLEGAVAEFTEWRAERVSG